MPAYAIWEIREGQDSIWKETIKEQTLRQVEILASQMMRDRDWYGVAVRESGLNKYMDVNHGPEQKLKPMRRKKRKRNCPVLFEETEDGH